VIKGVACNRGVAVLRLEGPGVGCKPGIIAEAGRSLSRRGINILSILTAQTCINLLIDRKDAQSAMESLSPLKNGMIGRIGLMEEISLVAVVGEGLGRRPGLAARIFSAVARSGINVLMIASGATEAASYFIVEAAEDVAAVTAIHREFFA